MAASKEDIRGWFKRGIKENQTHMIVMCDTFDCDDYPVYISTKEGQDIEKEVKEKLKGENMQKLMEVYDLSMDMESQLSERRSFHY